MKFKLDDLLTVPQVAKILNRSDDTIRRWHKKKILVPQFLDRRGAKTTRFYTKQQVKLFKEGMGNEFKCRNN